LLNATILLIGASRPALIGVYNDEGCLLESFEIAAPLTEGLYPIAKALDDRYKIAKLLYARGPGSFTGLKLSYLFCKTFALARDIEFLAADSFALSGDRPILAHGKRRFVKNGERIEIAAFDEPFEETLALPKRLDTRIFSDQTLPNYLLNAA
jgi:tRNA A37 threonylcarbamoyladenosine modification protein TsaB